VLHGTHDTFCPTRNPELLRTGIPGAELVRLDGARHAYFLERRREASRLVLDFLAAASGALNGRARPASSRACRRMIGPGNGHSAQPHKPGHRPGGGSRGLGIADGVRVSDAAKVAAVAARVAMQASLTFTQVMIDADEPPRALPARDRTYVKNRFRTALGFHTS
jgi:hypothetical protein